MPTDVLIINVAVLFAALDVLLGIVAAGGLMRIGFDDGQPVSTAGAAYAAFWSLVIGLRLLFTYGANQWYTTQLGHWMATNGISLDALTSGPPRRRTGATRRSRPRPCPIPQPSPMA